MTVYIVWGRDGDTHEYSNFQGVFSSDEKAQEYAEREYISEKDYYIQAVKVDGNFENPF